MITELPEIDASAFSSLIEHLSNRKLTIAKSQVLGIVRNRSESPDLSKCSWKDPKLHYLLMKFALMYLPSDFSFTSVQVNDSFMREAQFDRHNRGKTYIVAFGSFTGGEFVLKEGDTPRVPPGDKEFNIRHRPLVFDANDMENYTKEFEGRRWSIVFYSLIPHPKFPMIRTLNDYEAVCKDSQYVIAWYRQGEPTIYLSKKNGLSIPKKRKKKIVEKEEIVYDLRLTAAQNLMLYSQKSLTNENVISSGFLPHEANA